MKNKKLFLIPLILFFPIMIFAKNVELSFEPEFGGIYGTIFENVWYADSIFTQKTITTTPTAKESQLDWQLQNVPYIGAAVNLTFSEHYSFDFDLKTAFPGLAGIMEDYDWLNPIYWPSDPIDQLTNYSIHLMYLKHKVFIFLGKVVIHFTKVTVGQKSFLQQVPQSLPILKPLLLHLQDCPLN